MLGVFVNVVAVLIGGLLGVLMKKGIPSKVEKGVMSAVGLCCVVIGVDGALNGMEVLIVVISMVLGAIVGGILDLDHQMNRLGSWVERKMRKEGGTVSLAEGFVSATLLFCVGAMAIVGSLNSGLRGDHTMTFTKSLLDFFSSMMMAVSLGVGVMLSSVSILVYQGLIVLLAGVLEPMLNAIPGSITQIACVGSVMIIGIGTNLLGVTKIKVANFLPGLLVAPVAVWVASLLEKLA